MKTHWKIHGSKCHYYTTAGIFMAQVWLLKAWKIHVGREKNNKPRTRGRVVHTSLVKLPTITVQITKILNQAGIQPVILVTIMIKLLHFSKNTTFLDHSKANIEDVMKWLDVQGNKPAVHLEILFQDNYLMLAKRNLTFPPLTSWRMLYLLHMQLTANLKIKLLLWMFRTS